MKTLRLTIGFVLACLGSGCIRSGETQPNSDQPPPKVPPKVTAAQIEHLEGRYPQQYTYPQKRDRNCLCQFGYGIQYSRALFFPMTDFAKPDDLGLHSYGKPSLEEKNGMLYTCRGGFVDLSHLRVGVDWTVHLAFAMMSNKEITLEDGSATLKLTVSHLDELSLPDVVALAQRIAFERLVWHEVASWYMHPPNVVMSEQQSAFTPDDLYSDLAGTIIGKNLVLRIVENMDTAPYAELATQEIDRFLATLDPVSTEEAMLAYDLIDRHVQIELPETEQNRDIWWDSGIVFRDPRYVFKRYMNIGPLLEPWLVPYTPEMKCPEHSDPLVLEVPQKTYTGKSLNAYYDLTIIPDDKLFFDKLSGKELHAPFGPFSTKDMRKIIDHVKKDMERSLLADFDKRNSNDPVPDFANVKEALIQ